MRDLVVTLVQSDIFWQQPQSNRERLAEQLASLKGGTDLIILPEMFTTGFTMEPEHQAEEEMGATTTWMVEQAELVQAAIIGSVATRLQGGGFRNRLLFCVPGEQPVWYDKRHLFRMAGEHNHYQAGTQRVVFSYQGWRILPLICYDLRFPVFSRNRNDYDLMVCVANWPAPRRETWRTLLKARAIENQCFVAGVNRVGRDGKGLEYSGDSLLVDFKGDCLIDRPVGEPFILSHRLEASSLEHYREAFPAWMDADQFEIID